MEAASIGGRSSRLLGTNSHAGELALGHCRLAFSRRLRWGSAGREGNNWRQKIGLAVDQAGELDKHRKAHLAHLTSRQLSFGGYNVDEFFEVHGMRIHQRRGMEGGLHSAPSSTADLLIAILSPATSLCAVQYPSPWASHSSLERIDGLDDESPTPSDGQGLDRHASGSQQGAIDLEVLRTQQRLDLRGCLKTHPAAGQWIKSTEWMRGQQERTGPLFSYISTEDGIPTSHPLRQVRHLADQALGWLNLTLRRLYPKGCRFSISPEQLPPALLLQAIYGIRSLRMLINKL
jgi:hypothetical protein